MSAPRLPRYVPDRPLPPYTFVPGRSPHPVSDPAGHQYGKPPETPDALDADNWHTNRTYLYGIDLFNHGFYWEAHEAWESLWHRAGRKGPTADFLKALIQLAAAGVKHLEGVPAGVQSHGRRAAELFGAAQGESFLGFHPGELKAMAVAIRGGGWPALVVLAPTGRSNARNLE
jgi:hypothetical protein